MDGRVQHQQHENQLGQSGIQSQPLGSRLAQEVHRGAGNLEAFGETISSGRRPWQMATLVVVVVAYAKRLPLEILFHPFLSQRF
jgi:hypothetical protein